MRTVVSSSLFGFVACAAFALAGCAFESPAEPAAEQPSPVEGFEAVDPAMPEPGSVAGVPGGSSVSEGANPELDPSVDDAAELADVELTYPVGEAPGPVIAHDNAKSEHAGPAAAPGCSSDADCGTPACYDGTQESFFCDATGTCQVKIDSCGFYACDDTACRTACRSDAECAEGAHCVGGRCEAK